MKYYTNIIRGHNGKIYLVLSDGTIEQADSASLQTLASAEPDGKNYLLESATYSASAIEQAKAILRDMEREAKKQAEEDDARERCKAYAEELEACASGNAYICPVCGEIITADEMDEHEDEDGNTLYTCPHCGANFEEDEAEQASIYDYFKNNDIYNIEYRIDEQNDLRSVKIMIACGGPNIYIDTGKNAICLYWWGTSAEYPIDSDTAAAVEEYAREMRGE